MVSKGASMKMREKKLVLVLTVLAVCLAGIVLAKGQQAPAGVHEIKMTAKNYDFDPGVITPDHLGIAIMRERANSIGASLKIESQIGQGTTVELDWRSAREN